MKDAAISVNEVSFKYANQQEEVLKAISFQIDKGDKVALMGLNGSGKSTLLKLLVGLEKASTGSIWIGNTLIRQTTIKEIQQRVGYIFQNADDQLFMPTVFEDVAFGVRQLYTGQALTSKVETLLLEMSLNHLKDKAPFQLSGGEKRAVAIATVLVMSPEIILMDEPSEGLDARMRRKIIDLINSRDETFVISTHDENLAKKTCNKTIILEKGRIIGVYETKWLFDTVNILTKYALIDLE
jgi:cobalt/nickel transport system ATP-binding protein